MKILTRVFASLKNRFARLKTKKTRLAEQAESQMREVARLGQNLVVMELSERVI